MKHWQKISRKPIPRSDETYYTDLSPYYYGGRVECFEKGIIDTEFSVYDMNSAYPDAMLQSHPYSTEYVSLDGHDPDADFYTLTCESHGVFPFRGNGIDGERGGLYFPHDGKARTFHVSKWEYHAAAHRSTCPHHGQFCSAGVWSEEIFHRRFVLPIRALSRRLGRGDRFRQTEIQGHSILRVMPCGAVRDMVQGRPQQRGHW